MYSFSWGGSEEHGASKWLIFIAFLVISRKFIMRPRQNIMINRKGEYDSPALFHALHLLRAPRYLLSFQ
jgi:hypothetical protein